MEYNEERFRATIEVNNKQAKAQVEELRAKEAEYYNEVVRLKKKNSGATREEVLQPQRRPEAYGYAHRPRRLVLRTRQRDVQDTHDTERRHRHGGYGSYHHGIAKFSDMPTTKKGSWFLNDREKCDKNNVMLLEGLLVELSRIRSAIGGKIAAHQKPTAAELHYLRRLSRTVNQLRADTFLYKEFSSIENLEILGEDFIAQCYRDMPPATFRTTIMCRRVEHSEDSFYNGKTDRNLYTSVNKAYIDSLGYDMEKLRRIDCRTDGDIIPGEPLWVAMDANAYINWAVIGQPGADMKLRILKSFYVKYERRLPELVDDICAYYAPLKHKEMVFVFDSTFVGNNYGVSKADFHTVVKDCFIKHGWVVRELPVGNPWKHPIKQQLINGMFRGQRTYTVLINEENNPDLLVSIDSAMTVNGTNQKDKSGEKKPETEEDPLQSRTDGSDAFDTICIGVEAGNAVVYGGGGGGGGFA